MGFETTVSSDSGSPKNSPFVAAVNTAITVVRENNEAIHQNNVDQAQSEHKINFIKSLIAESDKLDTVFGYNFEIHPEVEEQTLHPYMTTNATAFGGSLAYLMHGRITLPRTETDATNESAKWLIFSECTGIYCIPLESLKKEALKKKEHSEWGFVDNPKIGDINAQLKYLGISRYGWANDEKKNKLIPHSYVTYVDAMLASLASLPFYLLPAPYHLFGLMFTMGIFFHRLHPQLASIAYQNKNKGHRPTIAKTDIVYHDSVTIGIQTGLVAGITTFMMNTELHDAIGFSMSDAVRHAVPGLGLGCSIVGLSVIVGAVVGATLYGIAHMRQNEKNTYSSQDLRKVFASGFLAGALIYPMLFLASTTIQPYLSSLILEYAINIALGSALHLSMPNRLDPAETKSTEKPLLNSKSLSETFMNTLVKPHFKSCYIP